MIYALQFTVVTVMTTILRAAVILGMAFAYAQLALIVVAFAYLLTLIF